MSVLCKDLTGHNMMFLKGAPDFMLKHSPKLLTKNGEIKEVNKQVIDNILEKIK